MPTAFYRHYATMDELGLELVAESFRALRRTIRKVRGEAQPGRKLIRHYVAALVGEVHDARRHFQFIARERYGGYSSLREAIRLEIRLFAAELATDLAHYPVLDRWDTESLQMLANLIVNAMVSIAGLLTAHGFAAPRLWSRGVDTTLFNPDGPREPRGEAPVFLYVGRLAVEKQVDAFLRLDLPGEKWVVGDGPEAARLRAAYPQARFFGALHGQALAQVYRSADVKVFPSLTDTFGLVLVEAMASGTPVAAYPVAGPIDVVGNSPGGVLDADLRSACLAALHLPRALVRAEALKFSWSAATDQFFGAFQPIPG